MKKMGMIVSLILLVFTLSGIGYATDVSFTDSVKYWGDGASWATGEAWKTDVPGWGWDGNAVDVIGDPDITGGMSTFSAAGKLTRITFNYTADDHSWTMQAPGNLFINVLTKDDDTIWDYVVTTMGIPINNPDGITPSLLSGNYDLRNISIDARHGINDDKYVLSGADNKDAWAGYVIRDNHPIGVKDAYLGSLAGSVYFSGFPGEVADDTTPWVGAAYYDFTNRGSNGGLDLGGKNIIIGWEMTCANDVIYVKDDVPSVPEPATMLLLGLGLVGLAGIRRKISAGVRRM